MWGPLGIYTPGISKVSPASSPAATDAPTEILTAIDDSAPKREIDTVNSSSKKIKTEYLVMSSSEDEHQAVAEDEIRYVSLNNFNELFQNAEQFQRMAYDLLHGLRAEISDALTGEHMDRFYATAVAHVSHTPRYRVREPDSPHPSHCIIQPFPYIAGDTAYIDTRERKTWWWLNLGSDGLSLDSNTSIDLPLKYQQQCVIIIGNNITFGRR